MRDLTELVCTLPWGKLKNSSLWEVVLQPGSKMARLFDIVYQQKVTDEQDIADLIYGPGGSLTKLRSLKNKLKDRLLELLFLLDFREPGYSDRQQAHFECNKRWATAMTLLAKKIKDPAVEQLELLLRHARHFEFTDLTLNTLNHLRLHYGTIDGDQKKYELYRELYKHYQSIWLMENEAEELYTQLINRYVASRAPQQDVESKATEYYAIVSPYLAKSGSFRLQLSGRLLQMMVFSCRNDYAAMADLCEEAIAFFRAKPYESYLPLQAFYYQLVVSCVQLRDFGRGQLIIRQNADIYEAGSFNWFKVQELYLLLALHTQHYDDAYDTCMMVLGHSGMTKQPAQIQEMWKIYEAYMHLLIRIRRVDRMPEQKFRLAKFLNETPVFSRDKRGMNIPILILQMLYDIADQRYDSCIDRLEAVEKYTSRYLKKDQHFRSNCFIKALVQIPAAAFHREAAARKADRYLGMLREMPLELANQAYEIEIIPYDDLWTMILDILPGKRISI
ncbi:MAG: hypothetical protein EP344_00555 [Bacteroidetes bacterium]|nr:MAG: hypothetical protein EP344_00555 [Bacteroidota bacterium]